MDKCTVCGKEGGELREMSFRTAGGELEKKKHCPTCFPLKGVKGDVTIVSMSFGGGKRG